MNLKNGLLMCVTFIVVVCSFSAFARPAGEISLVNKGRTVALDAFLIDWNIKSRKPLNNASVGYFDVIATPEGICGYCIFTKQDSCPVYDLRIVPDLRALHRYTSVPLTRVSTKSVYSATGFTPDKDSLPLVEWLVPWENLSYSDSLHYRMGFVVVNACSAIVAAQSIVGSKNVFSPKKGIVSNTLIFQGLFVVFLFVAFFFMKARFVKKPPAKRRKRIF